MKIVIEQIVSADKLLMLDVKNLYRYRQKDIAAGDLLRYRNRKDFIEKPKAIGLVKKAL